MWWTFLDAGKRKVFKSKVTSFHICDLVRSLQYVSKICSLKLEMLCSKVFSSLLLKCGKIWSRIGVRIKISPYIEPTAISSALNIIFLLCHSHSYVFFFFYLFALKSFSSHTQVIFKSYYLSKAKHCKYVAYFLIAKKKLVIPECNLAWKVGR